MCSTDPIATPTKAPHLKTPDIFIDSQDDHHWCPTSSEVVEEVRAIARISIPSVLTGVVLYSRSLVSTLFLGRLGELELAGGALALGFANITGYSILSGLSMGMEPLCGQAFGSGRYDLLAVTLHRTILLLLLASLPISSLWLRARPLLLWCRQDPNISATAARFLAPAALDLFVQSFLHPLRIYLRSQNMVLPITCCSMLSIILHIPINYLLVVHFQLGVAGVALAMVWTNFNLLQFLAVYVFVFRGRSGPWARPGLDGFRRWLPLLRLAAPTCAAVCLEWWWYELMVILCGLLANPRAAVASMGIVIQATSLVYVFPASLGAAASTRVANELGAGRAAGARLSAAVAMRCAVALGVAAAAFAAVVRHQWGRLFARDPAVLGLTAAALPVVGLCEIGNCPQTAACGVLRGSARPSTGAAINLGCFYGVGLPVAVAMGFVARLGFEGLWVGLLAAQLTCAARMSRVIANTDWVVEIERAMELAKSLSSPSLDARRRHRLGDAATTATDADAAAAATTIIVVEEESNLCIGDSELGC